MLTRFEDVMTRLRGVVEAEDGSSPGKGVKRVLGMKDRETGASIGFCFVEMRTTDVSRIVSGFVLILMFAHHMCASALLLFSSCSISLHDPSSLTVTRPSRIPLASLSPRPPAPFRSRSPIPLPFNHVPLVEKDAFGASEEGSVAWMDR